MDSSDEFKECGGEGLQGRWIVEKGVVEGICDVGLVGWIVLVWVLYSCIFILMCVT